MRASLVILSLSAFVYPVFCSAVELDSEEKKLSYSIGNRFGDSVKSQGVQLNQEAFAQGLTDSLQNAKPRLDLQDMEAVLQQHMEKQYQKRMADQQEAGKKNIQISREFLEKNKTQPGVQTLPSGLQYKILKNGDPGQSPKKESYVKVDYQGHLIDGTVFDSSIERKSPVTFPVNGVIQGWQEALQLMKPGDIWEVYIPSTLAYGEQGAPPKIGPNSALIFEIRLLSVLSEKEAKEISPASQ